MNVVFIMAAKIIKKSIFHRNLIFIFNGFVGVLGMVGVGM
jgi:hypothetical protein